MMTEWNYSIVGIASIVWTVLLVLVSYVCIRKRQQKLLEQIEQTNRMSEHLASKNSEMEKLIQQDKSKESSDDDDEDEEDECEEATDQPVIVSSDDIMKEATSDLSSPDRDPFDYCEHIQGEVKRLKQKVTQKKIIGEMSTSEMDAEREVQRKQMEAIFKLMAEKEGKFGMGSLEDMQSQMKMYL